MEANAALQVRIDAVEKRMDRSEGDRQDIWRHQGMMETRAEVLDERLLGIKNDIAEMRDEMKWVRRGLLGSTVGFVGLILTGVALILQGAA
jgi:hypothetical protein